LLYYANAISACLVNNLIAERKASYAKINIVIVKFMEKLPEFLNALLRKNFHKIRMYPVFHLYQGYGFPIDQCNVKL
jgi:alanyl-tRNA synthetase